MSCMVSDRTDSTNGGDRRQVTQSSAGPTDRAVLVSLDPSAGFILESALQGRPAIEAEVVGWTADELTRERPRDQALGGAGGHLQTLFARASAPWRDWR